MDGTRSMHGRDDKPAYHLDFKSRCVEQTTRKSYESRTGFIILGKGFGADCNKPPGSIKGDLFVEQLRCLKPWMWERSLSRCVTDQWPGGSGSANQR